MLRLLLFCLGSCGLILCVQGGVLVDNGTPDLRSGFEMTHWIDADQFAVGSMSAIQSITFWDVEGVPDFQGSVVWQIFADNQNSPGILVASGTAVSVTHSSTGRIASPNFPEYIDTFSVDPVTLTPGTYWLALHNGPISYNVTKETFWETASNSSTIPSRTIIAPFTGAWWSDYANSKLAFRIAGLILPRVISISTRPTPAFSFASTAGQVYRAEYKNNLTDSMWTTVSGYGSITGTGGTIQVSDSNANNLPSRFYHIVAVQ